MSRFLKELATQTLSSRSVFTSNLLCKVQPVYNFPHFCLYGILSKNCSVLGFPSVFVNSSKLTNKANIAMTSERNVRRVDLTFVRFAGHSHWHNIRHIKESKDALKQKLAADIVRRIKVAVREGGGTNPKFNYALARVLEDGKAKDVSNVTMTEALKRLEKSKDVKGSQVFIEAKGVGNCMLIVETYTDRPKWTRQEVQHIMKQFGGRIGEAGTSAHSFHFKGIVYLPKEKENPLSEDKALEIAIEVGAEEVLGGQDSEGQDAFQLICDPKQLHAVKRALEERGLKPETARLEYVPHMFTKLDEASLEVASKMLDSLETLEDVVRVYDNIES